MLQHTILKHFTHDAPLSDAQIQEAAPATGNPWSNLWFGRRDLIPPADDPRTNLIDRGMVAHGLITPEELGEIHRVGKEMDAVRPDIAMAAHVAQHAVAEDKEARRKLREQRKQEAAERKRKRAERITHRKATDIVYLGRGVSRGLADRRSNVEKLSARGLPVLATPGDVAAALGTAMKRKSRSATCWHGSVTSPRTRDSSGIIKKRACCGEAPPNP